MKGSEVQFGAMVECLGDPGVGAQAVVFSVTRLGVTDALLWHKVPAHPGAGSKSHPTSTRHSYICVCMALKQNNLALGL